MIDESHTQQTANESPPNLSTRRAWFLAFGFVALCTIAVSFVGHKEAWQALRSARPAYVAAAAAVMAVGWLAWALLYQSLLSGLGKPQPLHELYFIVLAGLAAVRVVPSAGAAGAALRFYCWRRRNVESDTIVATLVGSEAAFYSGLLILLWGGLVHLHGHSHLPHSLITSAFSASLVVTLVFMLVIAGFSGKRIGVVCMDRIATIVNAVARRLVRKNAVEPERLKTLLSEIAVAMRTLGANYRYLLLAVLSANAWWLANLCSVRLVFRAFGTQVPWGDLVVAYVLSALASAFAGIVAGLGATEAMMIGVLALLGTPAKSATLAILVFRLIEFWLPIPLGILSFHRLRLAVKE